ncbi:YtpR family tRNA-binding protein [Pediococcus argentinicus]|uniref:EMAP domain-containing protein n=1 Tax=Pediococcus argentinicus TaxID=480391 RepID=A0A0R2NLF7_9LACO|nr:DUF4479 and tRNA-binding domain-containing protein [Pediococcus argentinicus]KRO25682.1 EMAP domain-containing protein [Pediococcus argentinicus]NKZ21981.1 DUF4479 and tRNA-binding domain-containing protein [Pediococcus argentinicus]GEP19150.1 tRNA-binding protein [Pediococcus argentinicus]
MIASYNKAAMGDNLIVILKPDVASQDISKNGSVVRIFNTENNETIGFNFINASEFVTDLDGVGEIKLTDKQIKILNQKIVEAGFDDQLEIDNEPKFVVGYVKSTTKHPDSDHLLITETEVEDGKTVQIVSGSPNMTDNIKVVVAKVGAMMPSGLIIWPGELRGVESNGMICSGRELGLKNAPTKKGALILPDDFVVGTEFDFDKGNQIFK